MAATLNKIDMSEIYGLSRSRGQNKKKSSATTQRLAASEDNGFTSDLWIRKNSRILTPDSVVWGSSSYLTRYLSPQPSPAARSTVLPERSETELQSTGYKPEHKERAPAC